MCFAVSTFSLRDDRRHARVRGVDPQKLTRHTVFVRAIQRCPDVPDGFCSLLELLESCSLERVNDQAHLLLILLVFSLEFRQLDVEHEAVCLIPRRPINTVKLADLIRVLINELFFLLRGERGPPLSDFLRRCAGGGSFSDESLPMGATAPSAPATPGIDRASSFDRISRTMSRAARRISATRSASCFIAWRIRRASSFETSMGPTYPMEPSG